MDQKYCDAMSVELKRITADQTHIVGPGTPHMSNRYPATIAVFKDLPVADFVASCAVGMHEKPRDLFAANLGALLSSGKQLSPNSVAFCGAKRKAVSINCMPLSC